MTPRTGNNVEMPGSMVSPLATASSRTIMAKPKRWFSKKVGQPRCGSVHVGTDHQDTRMVTHNVNSAATHTHTSLPPTTRDTFRMEAEMASRRLAGALMRLIAILWQTADIATSNTDTQQTW
jgi:hypothetical protein